MHWETTKKIHVTCFEILYSSGLELNTQYLQGMPVFKVLRAKTPPIYNSVPYKIIFQK